jgi:hypothetical protein
MYVRGDFSLTPLTARRNLGDQPSSIICRRGNEWFRGEAEEFARVPLDDGHAPSRLELRAFARTEAASSTTKQGN